MLRKLLVGVLALLGLLIVIVALIAALQAADRSPSYGVPLKIDGPVSTTNLVVRVSKPDTYTVSLSYPYVDGVERRKAWTLAGGDSLKDGLWQEPGSPFVFQIRINEISSGKEMLNQQVTHPKLTSWGSGNLNADLVRIKLESGLYRVFVQRYGNLAEAPPAELQLQFHRAYQGK
ncbi:hypothetical protein [Pseudomonas sp. SMN5]|uniref:hypothetical protein n=1 Tax=Pseudomonas sp. SMN5 TaxID=3390198 RepID=UPI003F82DED9